ncbi:CBS domain-containing protein [Alphaproteobacteria bacterium]|jgi:CBS domain-containing protein|nr:CBS domain-containing protein [Alphaproteobacteria bacterium]
MTIGAILQNKGHDVVTIDQNATIKDAVDVLTSARIGAVLVYSSDNKFIAILSERDVMRAISNSGQAAMLESVSGYVSKTVYTIDLSTTIDEAMGMMTGYRCRHLPVLDGDDMIGIISIGDLVNFKIQEADREAEALKEYIKTG